MAMRETDHSMSLYFGLIGMIGLVSLFLQTESVFVKSANISVIFSNPGVLTYIFFNLFLAVTYLTLAFRLRAWLVTNPNIVRGIVVASMILASLNFLVRAIVGAQFVPPISLIVELGIGIYLLLNVNRLVRELNE